MINYHTSSIFPSSSININDSLIYAMSVYESPLYNFTNLIKIYPKTTTAVNRHIENSQYFFSTPPVPTPAKDIVRFTIYWYLGVEIKNAKVKVYNFLGNEITSGNEILTIPNKFYSEEIVWDCSNVPNGLYIVNISYNNFSKSVPIIVVK